MRLPGLEARLRSGVFRSALRGLALWLCASAILWCAATAAFLLVSPPAWAGTGLLLAILSLLPAFLLWPPEAAALQGFLRGADEATAIEAFLEAEDGPARPLLGKLALERDGALPYLPKPRPRLPRSILPLAGASVLAFALLEFTAVLVLHKPVLAYAGPREAAGSGLRVGERSLPAVSPAQAPESTAAQVPPAAAQDAPEPRSARRAEKEAELDAELEATTRRAAPGEEGAASSGTPAAETPPQGSGSEGAGSKGLSGKAEGNEAADETGLAGKGYTGSGRNLPKSPLVDYRARVFQALTDSGGSDVEAGEGMDAATLRDFERRYFSGFQLTSGSLPRDDAWAALVKRRWREGAGGGK